MPMDAGTEQTDAGADKYAQTLAQIAQGNPDGGDPNALLAAHLLGASKKSSEFYENGSGESGTPGPSGEPSDAGALPANPTLTTPTLDPYQQLRPLGSPLPTPPPGAAPVPAAAAPAGPTPTATPPTLPNGPPPAIKRAVAATSPSTDQALIQQGATAQDRANQENMAIQQANARAALPVANANDLAQQEAARRLQENQQWASNTAKSQLQNAVTGFQQYANSKVNPSEFWDSRSTGQQFGISAAMFLSGIGSALTHQDNAAMKIYESARDADIQAQKDAFERNRVASNAYGELMTKATQAGLSEGEASAATTNALKAIGDQHMKAVLASSGNAQAQADFDAANAGNKLKLSQDTEKLFSDVSARHLQTANAASAYQAIAGEKYHLGLEKAQNLAYPQWSLMPPQMRGAMTNEGPAASPEQAKQVQDADKAYAAVNAAGNDYISSLKRPGGIRETDRRAAAKNYQAALADYMNIARAAGQPEEKGSALNTLANPGWIENAITPGEALMKAQAAQQLMKHKHAAVIGGINKNLAPKDLSEVPNAK